MRAAFRFASTDCEFLICRETQFSIMIEILLYGNVKEIVRDNIPNADTILLCDFIEGEHFKDLLHRLGLKLDDVGNCYINNSLAKPDNPIHDLDTIELNQRSHTEESKSN